MAKKLVILETNIDDCTPELLSYATEILMDAGALDVHLIPCVMKKGRTGFLLRVLTDNPQGHSEILMRETGTLGVRALPIEKRYEAGRETETLEIKIKGKTEKVRVKKSSNRKKPEYDDIREIAKKYKLTFREVEGIVNSAL